MLARPPKAVEHIAAVSSAPTPTRGSAGERLEVGRECGRLATTKSKLRPVTGRHMSPRSDPRYGRSQDVEQIAGLFDRFVLNIDAAEAGGSQHAKRRSTTPLPRPIPAHARHARAQVRDRKVSIRTAVYSLGRSRSTEGTAAGGRGTWARAAGRPVTPTNLTFGTVITWRTSTGSGRGMRQSRRTIVRCYRRKHSCGASLAHSNSQAAPLSFVTRSIRCDIGICQRRRSDAGPFRETESAPFGLRDCEAMATCRTGLFLAAAKGTPHDSLMRRFAGPLPVGRLFSDRSRRCAVVWESVVPAGSFQTLRGRSPEAAEGAITLSVPANGPWCGYRLVSANSRARTLLSRGLMVGRAPLEGRNQRCGMETVELNIVTAGRPLPRLRFNAASDATNFSSKRVSRDTREDASN